MPRRAFCHIRFRPTGFMQGWRGLVSLRSTLMPPIPISRRRSRNSHVLTKPIDFTLLRSEIDTRLGQAS